MMWNNFFAQKENSFQLIAQPFVQRFGNLNKQYTSVSNDKAEVDYLKIPASEFGFQFNHKAKNKWGWGVGITNIFQKNEVYFKYFFHNYPLFTGRVKMNVSYLSLRFASSYQVNSKMTASFLLAFNSPYKYKSNGDAQDRFYYGEGSTYGLVITPDTSYSTFEESRKIYISGSPYLQMFIPELNISYNFWQHFNLQLGVKFQFIDLDKTYGIIRVDVSGKNKENGFVDQVLHESHVKNTNYSYYTGITYNIPLKRKATK